MTITKRLLQIIISPAVLPAICLAICLVSAARAEPLDRKEIAADAKWLFHIDFDAGKATKVGYKVYEDWLSHGFAKATLRDVRETIGLDLLADVRGMTFYATGFELYGGVVIVRAKVDRERLLRILDDDATHAEQTCGDHKLHTWVQEVEGLKSEVTGCFYRPDMVVVGRKAAEVKAALDVLNSKKPNLADSGSALNRKAAKGTVFELGAVGLANLDSDKIPFVSPVIRYCRSLLIDIGEDDRQVFISTRLDTKTNESARQIQDVIDGFLAMKRLERADDKIFIKSLDGMTIKAHDATVRIDWRMPGPVVMRLIEQEWKKQQQAN
ncbi:MAG: hypothetical protein U9N87_04520 [Planctomycetota bacterium]|nr:hypothetical protein [Planctomycetota bacterium]